VLDRPDGIKADGSASRHRSPGVDLSVGESVAGVLKTGGVTNVHGVLLVLYGGSVRLAVCGSGVFLTLCLCASCCRWCCVPMGTSIGTGGEAGQRELHGSTAGGLQSLVGMGYDAAHALKQHHP